MEYGLIGEKLSHSFSKELHGLIGNYDYSLVELANNELEPFLTSKDFCGINITIPYKQDVIPYLDYIDDNAKSIGAVNTIVNKNGKLYGYNTDFLGMRFLIENTYGNSLCGKKVLILGSGGTSKTAFSVAKSLGAQEAFVVSRKPISNEISYNEAIVKHSNAHVIINTTPVGMYPNVNNSVIDLSNFDNLELVVDAIYNPLNTKFVLDAKNLGIKATGGLLMLAAQAVYAYGLFFDKVIQENKIIEVYKKLINLKQNIALVGMPSSGKTTIGKILAKKLCYRFVDTDQLIIEKAAMPIPDIFAEYSEEYFRKLESEVIAEVSLESGVVISTGGGAVLKEENVFNLKRNSKIFFLDRELSELLPTNDRPLANNIEKIKKLYEQRIVIYKSSADYILKPTTIEETADIIIKNR